MVDGNAGEWQGCGHYGWLDDFHQRQAFKTKYNPDFNAPESLKYKHWLFETYRNRVVPIDQMQEFFEMKRGHLLPEEKIPPDGRSKTDFRVGRTFVIIGDSLGGQIYQQFKGYSHIIYGGQENCEEQVVEFWGQGLTKGCEGSRAMHFQQTRLVCTDPEQERPPNQVVLIPHGKPLQQV